MLEATRFETSVCCLEGVVDDRIALLSRTVRPDQRAIGAAEVEVNAVRGVGLNCLHWPEHDYAEHAIIIGWPGVPDPDYKAKQLDLCQKLARVVRRTRIF
jgi:hypothetical protein